MGEIPVASTTLTITVFAIVYAGMFLGGLPRLHLDRTGVALLGAIAIVGTGVMTPETAARAVHLPTILLLFSFMVISAQMRLGGFYAAVTRRIATAPLTPGALLALVIAVSAALSAVFSNDIVCLAMAPVLASACVRRRFSPVPFLVALAAASNIGSAATLIGNPQNMFIGEALRLPFGGYAMTALPPVVAGLFALWAITVRLVKTEGFALPVPTFASSAGQPLRDEDANPPFDWWQSAKGLVIAAALLAIFLATDWPRDVAALVGAGVLLLSQRFHSSKVMGLIDWELLILFIGLFVVNHALDLTGLTSASQAWLTAHGVHLDQPMPLFLSTVVLSNVVSNVPAVMLLMPAAGSAQAGPTLALVSTLAGNLLIVGSIANIIVVDAARRQGIEIDWRTHARIGMPVTAVTLGIAALWLACCT